MRERKVGGDRKNLLSIGLLKCLQQPGQGQMEARGQELIQISYAEGSIRAMLFCLSGTLTGSWTEWLVLQ